MSLSTSPEIPDLPDFLKNRVETVPKKRRFVHTRGMFKAGCYAEWDGTNCWYCSGESGAKGIIQEWTLSRIESFIAGGEWKEIPVE